MGMSWATPISVGVEKRRGQNALPAPLARANFQTSLNEAALLRQQITEMFALGVEKRDEPPRERLLKVSSTHLCCCHQTPASKRYDFR